MGDIQNSRLLWVKFVLFIVLGILALVITLILHPDFRLAILIAIAVWAFCRAYYFAFYVISHYIDPTFRFAGLWSVFRYAVRHRVFTRRHHQPGFGDDQRHA